MSITFDAGNHGLPNAQRDKVGGNYAKQYSDAKTGIDEGLNTEVMTGKCGRDPVTGGYIFMEEDGLPSTSLLGRLGAWIWGWFAGDRQEVAPRDPGTSGGPTVPEETAEEGSLVPTWA